jgi:hypothetical protein
MRKVIALIVAALLLTGLSGCDSQAEPSASLMIRYQVDAATGRSWWLVRDGVVLHSAAEPKKAVALPGWLWTHEPFCPPDMALGPSGEAVVTTNVTNTLWRIDAQTLAVTVHALELDTDRGNDVGFVALAYVPEQAAYFAYSEGPPAIWRIDRQLSRATKLTNVNLTRIRSPRSANVRGPCAELGQRLIQFVRLGG